jgi:hypothetical protein
MHPHLQAVFRSYMALLRNTAHNSDEIVRRVFALGSAAGFDPDDYREILGRMLS